MSHREALTVPDAYAGLCRKEQLFAAAGTSGKFTGIEAGNDVRTLACRRMAEARQRAFRCHLPKNNRASKEKQEGQIKDATRGIKPERKIISRN